MEEIKYLIIQIIYSNQFQNLIQNQIKKLYLLQLLVNLEKQLILKHLKNLNKKMFKKR